MCKPFSLISHGFSFTAGQSVKMTDFQLSIFGKQLELGIGHYTQNIFRIFWTTQECNNMQGVTFKISKLPLLFKEAATSQR